MDAHEANRSRHLVIRVDRGEELPSALARLLGEGEARSAWIQGVGELEAAELAVYDQGRRDYARARRIDSPTTLVSLQGNAALDGGVLALRLAATLVRETDAGLEVLAGQLVWARAFAVELHVTVFEDLALVRTADERTGLARLEFRKAAAALESPPPAAAFTAAAPARAPLAAPSQPGDGPPMPLKPMRARDEPEFYPETGDAVMHFAFGECTVVGSDGDRIRLRQEKDGRMREVALAMLRIEEPTLLASGQRLFKLARKN